MKKLFLILCLFGIVQINRAQTIEPIKRTLGKLTLSIDPRMELLSAIQLTAKYPVVHTNNLYSRQLAEAFSSYDTLQAVRLTTQLKNHFSYDAPVTFMLYLSQPEELKPQKEYSEYLIHRARGIEHLKAYRQAVEDFARQTHFKEFWEKHQAIYNQILDKTIAECQETDWIEALEAYYGKSQNSYNIIISPSFRGGYGPQIQAPNGKWDIYACIGGYVGKDGIPYFNRNGLMYYLWHEFSHSYVNPETEKYNARIEASAKLYEPLKEVMTQQAYSNWGTCVNEHIVRAVHLRLIDLHIGHDAYRQQLEAELNNGFLYIEPLLGKLAEYEALKKTTPVTFSEFAPKLANVLDSLANINYQERVDPTTFRGPINKVFTNDKMAVIYPTNIADTAVRNKVQAYVRKVYKKFFNRPSNLLLADTSALVQPLADYALVIYGSVAGNLFLNRNQSVLPFTLNDRELVADRTYTQPGLKVVCCQPHPQNKKLGMAVYSAFSDQDVIDINNVFHGPEDYVIFTDRNHILKKGYYFNKSQGKWRFKE